MNFTRQDIQKLSSMLGRLSVKDSQFTKATVLSEEARVPVLDDGVNKTASAKLLSKWVAKNINLADIVINLNGADSSNLLSLLSELISKAGTPVTIDGQWLLAELLKCNKEFMGQTYTNFEDLLLQMIDAIEELYGLFESIKYAKPADIERIFT